MFMRTWTDNPTNKELVDRKLGIAYERVKKAIENLELIEEFNTNAGAFTDNSEKLQELITVINSLSGATLTNDLGTVNVTDEELNGNGAYWLAELSRCWPYMQTLYENIKYLEKSGLYIQDIIKVAAAIDSVQALSTASETINSLSNITTQIELTGNNIGSVVSLADKLSELVTLYEKKEEFSELYSNLDALNTISDKIHSLLTLSESIENINKAVAYYDVFKEVLDEAELLTALNNNKESFYYLAEHADRLDKIYEKLDMLDSVLKHIDNFDLLAIHIEDVHKVVDNIELIKTYSDMADKITALYSALYPMGTPNEVITSNTESLQTQINNLPSGSKIIFNKNVSENLVIPSGKSITLNLDGYTLSNRDNQDTIKVELGASLYIQNGSIDNTANGVACILNNGFCSIKDTSLSKSDGEYYAILNHGRMVLGSGTIVNLKPQATSSCVVNGYYDYTRPNSRYGYIEGTNLATPLLTINGGIYSGGRNTLKTDDGGVTVINGGEFNNSFTKDSLGAALFNVHRMTVNNCVVNAPGVYAVYNRSYNIPTDEGITVINNGTFTGTIYNVNTDGYITQNGGTYNG